MAQINAKFVTSNTDFKNCPPARYPEFAFIGRSNVGKSSLINMLLQRKGLAKTSQTPGKTQLINHFRVNEDWYLVDLPGYGYARTSKVNRGEWERFIRYYLRHRESLQCVFVLIDSRVEPQKNDIDFCNWLGETGIPFLLVFTKADKQSAVKTDQTVAKFRKELLKSFEEVPKIFITSSENALGREAILCSINELNQAFVL